MYNKLGFLSPITYPLKKEGRKKWERRSKSGFKEFMVRVRKGDILRHRNPPRLAATQGRIIYVFWIFLKSVSFPWIVPETFTISWSLQHILTDKFMLMQKFTFISNSFKALITYYVSALITNPLLAFNYRSPTV